MRLVAGTLLFWVSIFGYITLSKRKTKLPFFFALPIIFSTMSIVLFFAGILNVLREAAIVICIFGIGLLIYYAGSDYVNSVNIREGIKKYMSADFLILALLVIYVTIISQKMYPTHYDNFSHWATIVKVMFSNNALPNYKDSIIIFKGYAPGSACFLYYFGLLAGKTEKNMIVAQNYLMIAYFFSCFTFINEFCKKNVLPYCAAIGTFLFIVFVNIRPCDLLVDSLLATMAICLIAILFYCRDNIKRAVCLALPIVIHIVLVKTAGIIFMGFAAAAVFCLGINNKKIKQGIKLALLIIAAAGIVYFIWDRHVLFTFGSSAMASKHSLSAENIFNQLAAKNTSDILEFTKKYLKEFISFGAKKVPTYILGINVFFGALMLLYSKQIKRIIGWVGLCDAIYLLYYIALWFMYLMSMPLNELKDLASFDRYMFTIVIVCAGTAIIAAFDIAFKEEKLHTKSALCMIAIAVVTVAGTFISKPLTANILLGNQSADSATLNMVRVIKSCKNGTGKEGRNYYVYCENERLVDSDFIYYISRYHLYDIDPSAKVIAVSSAEDLEQTINASAYKHGASVILLDESEEVLNVLNKYGFREQTDNVYT